MDGLLIVNDLMNEIVLLLLIIRERGMMYTKKEKFIPISFYLIRACGICTDLPKNAKALVFFHFQK